MDSYDSESRRIFQLFSRSTKLASWNFKKLQTFAPFFEISVSFADFLQIFDQFGYFSAQSSLNFAGISQNAEELLKIIDFIEKFWNFAKIWRKKVQKFEN